MSSNKCVIVIDQNLPVGIIANTAAVLSLSLGRLNPEMIGYEIEDNNGNKHHGITTVAVPILKGTGLLLKEMRDAVIEYEPELTVIDLISATQTTKSYDEYSQQFASTPVEELEYLGIALYGSKKLVNKFTGNLGLLR